MDVEVWDVFAERPLAGNALAVVFGDAGLDPTAMQGLAREFQLSETVFVALRDGAAPRLRIFTPAQELPMAGHPTIGAAFALARRGHLADVHTRLELNVGAVDLDLERDAGGRLVRAWMDQGRPRRVGVTEDRAAVAGALGLGRDDLADGLPIEAWSTGNPFLMVPVRDLDALAAAWLDLARLGPWIDPGHRAVLAFVPGTDGGTVRCRMFGEALGVVEDPGTGSAHGPLGAYLVRHGLAARPTGADRVLVTSRQGVEMGRPSTIRMRLRALADESGGGADRADVAVEVGGAAVPVVLGGRLAPGVADAPS